MTPTRHNHIRFALLLLTCLCAACGLEFPPRSPLPDRCIDGCPIQAPRTPHGEPADTADTDSTHS